MSRILVVDDENSVQMALEMILTDQGLQVDKAKNGLKALEMMNQQKYDLVLTDIRMPEMNGLKLLKSIRQNWGESLPIICITAYANEEVVNQALKDGISDLINKPFDNQTVVEAVMHALKTSNESKPLPPEPKIQ